MKGIEKIIEEAGIEGDAAEALKKAIISEYRSTAELDDLKAKNAKLMEQVQGFGGTAEEVEKLRKAVADYKAAEEKREKDAKEQKEREAFKADFDKAHEGKEFANQATRAYYFDKAYAIHKTNPDMEAKDVLAAVIGNDDAWKNPNQPVSKVGEPAKGDDLENQKKALANLFFGSKA